MDCRLLSYSPIKILFVSALDAVPELTSILPDVNTTNDIHSTSDEIHIVRYSFTLMKLVYSHTISRFLSQWHEDYLLANNGFRLQYQWSSDYGDSSYTNPPLV
jgi:hypothetical protein